MRRDQRWQRRTAAAGVGRATGAPAGPPGIESEDQDFVVAYGLDGEPYITLEKLTEMSYSPCNSPKRGHSASPCSI